MPHAGLMDEEALGPEEAALQRSRLHVRGGRRRLRQGKISGGLAALHDALTSGMDWFFASAGRRSRVAISAAEARSDLGRYDALVRSGVLDGSFDFRAFDRVIDRTLVEEVADADHGTILRGIETALTQLGVLPFDESVLPAEDPRTL
jgi:hypothetical protein